MEMVVVLVIMKTKNPYQPIEGYYDYRPVRSFEYSYGVLEFTESHIFEIM